MRLSSAIGVCLLAALVAPTEGAAPERFDAASLPRGAASPAAIHPAVARIVAPGDGSISYGSGTLVYARDEFGLVITNWHVVNEATGPISVHFPDGFYSLGTVQQVDRDWDLAAIAVRKPNAQPVALADEAPRPGEVLTIAGYGSGSYRAASGRCTQYVAPGTSFPFEMVEVAVSARQGDSGGPIFNEKGELAGVLFGEGHGRTSGSYCGRVRWFLTSVVRDVPEAQTLVAGGALRPIPARPNNSDAEPSPRAVALAPATVARVTTAATESRATVSAVPTAAVAGAPGPAQPPLGQTTSLSWEDLAGKTMAEQVKTVLAMVGVLAMILHALRWLSADPAKG